MQHHMVILRNLVVIGLVTMAELFAPQLGYAQTWLTPAYPASAMLGPTNAKGAVIWSHGRSADAEDSGAPTPPFIAWLRNGGGGSLQPTRVLPHRTFAWSGAAILQDAHP